jgi:hypothetical protein
MRKTVAVGSGLPAVVAETVTDGAAVVGSPCGAVAVRIAACGLQAVTKPMRRAGSTGNKPIRGIMVMMRFYPLFAVQLLNKLLCFPVLATLYA